MSDIKAKPISSCFLYNKSNDYTSKMSNAIMKAERINKNSEAFMEDVALELKRSKMPIYTMKILTSSNTHLIWPSEPLPKGLKVFAAKDIKNGGKKYNIFIDCTGVITKKANDRYGVKVDVLIAYMLSAKNNMLYYALPGALTKKSSDLVLMTRCFSKLFTHVIDYISNISVIPEQREKCRYLSAKYFLTTVANIEDEERIEDIAVKAADITEAQARVFNISTSSVVFNSLPAFVDNLKDVFKLPKLTLTLVIEKFMHLYGVGTVFALEFLPTFLSLITDAYCGVYLNMQKTIEKILGKDLVELGKSNIYENNIRI